jgi:acetylornithine deacetylase/succinyl-diaminopimelate desuccinylase-like protein
LGLLHKLWGEQSRPQPPFRRPLAVANDLRTQPKPAESRLQPGLAAPQLVQNLSFAKNYVALGFSLCLFLPIMLCAAEPDWDAVRDETLEHFTHVLRMDTTNPPGNETQVAEYVKSIFEKEHIPVQLFAKDPNRANVVARLKGDGTARPIIILGHSDVVGVQREKWAVDPFGAIRKDGYIWGRGSTDDKDNLTAGLMVLLTLKRLAIPLKRDVIFLSEAGEETGNDFGINFLVEQHWPEIDAEFALAEGGYMIVQPNARTYVEVTTTEKVPRTLRLIAHGPAGHGSEPIPDNAVLRLASAVAKFSDWQPAARLNDTTRAYFERMASVSSPVKADRYLHVADPKRAAAIERYFYLYEPANFAVMRSTITPTILKGGFRFNVVPSEAEATLDVRVLPDENVPALIEKIKSVTHDPNIEIAGPPAGGRPIAAPSRLDTPMFHALEHATTRLFPDGVTIPAMSNGATDGAQLRAKGVQVYGVGGISSGGPMSGAHSDNERISEEGLMKLLQYIWYSTIEVAAK